MSLKFSDYFEVPPEKLRIFGTVDISLVCDLPLFIDPLLIFNSEKQEYQLLHKEIIRYFHFLARKAQSTLQKHEILTWFTFREVKQNWLGYCLEGNEGLALGQKFAHHLYNNIGFTINNNNITKSQHIEKAMLLYEGSGRDKISDLTVNLIKGYLCEYTQMFAEKNINSKYIKELPVENAFFNYKTESFVSKNFRLPYIMNKKGKEEYVLLTPVDILREKEPAINSDDYLRINEQIRDSIDNKTLRALVENYIGKAVLEYEQNQRENKKQINESQVRKIEKNAFLEITREYPILYDYYIKIKENEKNEVLLKECKSEVDDSIETFITNAQNLIDVFWNKYPSKIEQHTAIGESVERIKYLKHIIENCDGYRNFYVKGQRISREQDLQRMFKFVWFGTNYDVNFEVNNGRGAADTIVSMGRLNKCVIEFKLASNSRLDNIFPQVEIYKKANQTKDSLKVIFFFTPAEHEKVLKMLKQQGYEIEIEKTIFIIDCRNDNKASASKAG